MRYRKKPVEVEAVKLNAADINDNLEIDGDLFDCPPNWIVESPSDVLVVQQPESDFAHLKIITLEGSMIASPGDWIIRGIAGELYPCKPDIFEQTYEAA